MKSRVDEVPETADAFLRMMDKRRELEREHSEFLFSLSEEGIKEFDKAVKKAAKDYFKD